MRKKKHLCPFCFHEFDKIPFLCMQSKCRHNQQRQVFYPSKKFFGTEKKAICPECGNVSYTIVCPFCSSALPSDVNNEQKFLIPIIGEGQSGKSTYLGVLIHEMIHRIAPEYNGGRFEGVNDAFQRYQMMYEDLLYNGVSVCSSYQNNPMLFRYKYRVGKRIMTFDCVFYDSVSEDLMMSYNDMDNVREFWNSVFSHASGIIFMLDPMSISSIVNQLDKDWVTRASGGLQEHDGVAGDIISRVSRLIRNANGMREEQKIDIPVAAVFSKYDAFEKLVPEDATVRRASPHCKKGKFDDADRIAVDSEIAALLDEWGARSFTSQLENNYKTYSYFAVSALGLDNNPSSHRFNTPHPHRIEDPILWLMKENRIIK